MTAIAVGATRSFDVKARLSAIDYWLLCEGLTGGDADRLLWGVADASMTVSEIMEGLLAEPTYKGDIPAAERARRPFRVLGMVGYEGGAALTTAGNFGHRKVGLTIAEPVGYNYFVYNFSGAAITTGATFKVVAKEYAIDIE